LLINKVKEKTPAKLDKWISGAEAMSLLRIKSATTLKKLCDERKIRVSHPTSIPLYDRDSITDYLEDFTYETFHLPK
jgi:hypothetical protein